MPFLEVSWTDHVKLILRMADNCITCERPVTSRQQGIQCDVCSKWNHGTCITDKLPFILHLHSVCKTPFDLWGDVRYFAARNRSVAYFFFFIGISQQDYRAAVRTATGIDWVCIACQFFCPVAESYRISMTKCVSRNSWVVRVQPSFDPKRFVPVDDLQSPW